MAKAKDDGFTQRTLMALATDMADARERFERLCAQIEALAKEHGVKIPEPA